MSSRIDTSKLRIGTVLIRRLTEPGYENYHEILCSCCGKRMPGTTIYPTYTDAAVACERSGYEIVDLPGIYFKDEKQ